VTIKAKRENQIQCLFGIFGINRRGYQISPDMRLLDAVAEPPEPYRSVAKMIAFPAQLISTSISAACPYMYRRSWWWWWSEV